MSNYVLSKEADFDIENLTRESVKRWGFDQASRYVLELHGAFGMLAEFPHLGRNAGNLRKEYFCSSMTGTQYSIVKQLTAFSLSEYCM